MQNLCLDLVHVSTMRFQEPSLLRAAGLLPGPCFWFWTLVVGKRCNVAPYQALRAYTRAMTVSRHDVSRRRQVLQCSATYHRAVHCEACCGSAEARGAACVRQIFTVTRDEYLRVTNGAGY